MVSSVMSARFPQKDSSLCPQATTPLSGSVPAALQDDQAADHHHAPLNHAQEKGVIPQAEKRSEHGQRERQVLGKVRAIHDHAERRAVRRVPDHVRVEAVVYPELVPQECAVHAPQLVSQREDAEGQGADRDGAVQTR